METNNSNLKFKVKKRVLSCMNKTTSHGISHIARSNTWFFRIFWTLFFLGSLGYCSYTIVQSFIKYYNYETSVSISRIQDSPATFPAITICNLNPIDESNSEILLSELKSEISGLECYYKNNQNNSLSCRIPKNSNKSIDNFFDEIKRAVANKFNNEDKLLYGYNLDENTLLSCEYNNIPCDSNNFTVTWINEYGKCYTFNNNENDYLKTSLKGNDFGLKIELLVRLPLILNETEFLIKTGLHLVVHNQSVSPFSVMKYGINIPTGYETYVGIDRNFVNKLAAPYSDCITDFTSNENNLYSKKLFGYFNELNISNYDQNFCYTLCYQDKLLEKCGCLDLDTPKINNINNTFCVSESEIQCLNNFLAYFSESDLNEVCESACLIECNKIEYILETSLATYPTYRYLKNLRKKSKILNKYLYDSDLMEFTRTSLTKFIINYKTLYYQAIEDSPNMTPNDLFGALGGQLGLFIGLSVLSILEIIELIIDIIIIFIAHRYNHALTIE